MAFTLSNGNTITQSGTDTDLSGLAGISGVTVRNEILAGGSSTTTVYEITSTIRRFIVNGNLTINLHENRLVLLGNNTVLNPYVNIVGSVVVNNTDSNGVPVSNGAAFDLSRYYGIGQLLKLEPTASLEVNNGILPFATTAGRINAIDSTLRLNDCIVVNQGTTAISLDVRGSNNFFNNVVFEGFQTRASSADAFSQINGLEYRRADTALLYNLAGTPGIVDDVIVGNFNYSNLAGSAFRAENFNRLYLRFVNSAFGNDTTFTSNAQPTSTQCKALIQNRVTITALDINKNAVNGVKIYAVDVDNGNRFPDDYGQGQAYSIPTSGDLIYSGETGINGSSSLDVISAIKTPDGLTDNRGVGDSSDIEFKLFNYGYQVASTTPPLTGLGDKVAPVPMIEDSLITEQNKAVSSAYTTQETSQKAYDQLKSILADNYAGETQTYVTRSGSTLIARDLTVNIDGTGAGAAALNGSVLTLNANTFTGSIETTSDVLLDNGANVTDGTYSCNVITRADKTFTNVTISSSNVLQVTSGGTVTLDSSDITTVQNISGQQVNVVLTNGASIPNVTGGNITVINNMTVNFNGLQSGDVLYVRDNNGNTQDFINVTGTSQQITINRNDDGETWGYGVKRLGFAAGLGIFDVAEGTTLNINIALIQQLSSGGSPLYSGSTTPLMTVEINPDGSSMRGLIGNGAVSAQQYYDVTETALMSEDGLSYLFNGGGACTFSQTPTGTFLSLKDNYQVKRRNTGDDSSTVNAFVTSTQGTFIDSVNGQVQFVTVTTAQQLAEYDGFIWVDLIGGVDEFVYPAGTPTRKVNSIANAITLGDFYGINKIKISGDETMLSQEADGYEIVGDVTTTTGSRLIPKVTLSTANGANNSIFKDLIVDGSTDVSSPVFGNKFDACVINGLTGLTGIARSSKLAGILTIAYDLDIIDCFGTAALNVVGVDSSVSVPNFSGQLTIAGMTNAGATVSIGVISGVVIVDSSCTAGNIIIANADSVINNGNGVTVTEINDSSSGSFDDAATIYTYFTSSNREDAFKATGFATQSSVNAIPTNTLLANDARLNNLDATISSRSTFNPSTDEVTVVTNNDKTGYSLANNSITSSTVASNAFNNNTFTTGFYNQVGSEVDNSLSSYDAPTKAELDTAVSGLATQASVNNIPQAVDFELVSNHGSGSWVESTGFATPGDISSGFDEIKGVGWADETLKDIRDNLGTGGTTPQQVYDYFVAGSREDVFKADISDVATTVQLNAARDSVISEVNDNDAPTKAEMDAAVNSVLSAISNLPDSGSILGLLQKLELLEKYHDNTTAYLDFTGTVEVEQKDAYFTVVYDNDGTTELKRIAFQDSTGESVLITDATRYVKV